MGFFVFEVHAVTMFFFCPGPFKDYPQVTVYHPGSSRDFAFANIGWTGWIGSITGDYRFACYQTINGLNLQPNFSMFFNDPEEKRPLSEG